MGHCLKTSMHKRSPRKRGLFTRRASLATGVPWLGVQETAMWTLHLARTHIYIGTCTSVLAALVVPLPFYSLLLSMLPFAVSIISIHRWCLANRVDREAVSVEAQPLVNHGTVDDGNESPAIIVRIIETRWKPTTRFVVTCQLTLSMPQIWRLSVFLSFPCSIGICLYETIFTLLDLLVYLNAIDDNWERWRCTIA